MAFSDLRVRPSSLPCKSLKVDCSARLRLQLLVAGCLVTRSRIPSMLHKDLKDKVAFSEVLIKHQIKSGKQLLHCPLVLPDKRSSRRVRPRQVYLVNLAHKVRVCLDNNRARLVEVFLELVRPHKLLGRAYLVTITNKNKVSQIKLKYINNQVFKIQPQALCLVVVPAHKLAKTHKLSAIQVASSEELKPIQHPYLAAAKTNKPHQLDKPQVYSVTQATLQVHSAFYNSRLPDSALISKLSNK